VPLLATEVAADGCNSVLCRHSRHMGTQQQSSEQHDSGMGAEPLKRMGMHTLDLTAT
jgi:hypothetical protein